MDESELSECPICLSFIDVSDKENITVSCCKKRFHTVCWDRCLISKNECPMCRASHGPLGPQNTTPDETEILVFDPPIIIRRRIYAYRSWHLACAFVIVSGSILILGYFT